MRPVELVMIVIAMSALVGAAFRRGHGPWLWLGTIVLWFMLASSAFLATIHAFSSLFLSLDAEPGVPLQVIAAVLVFAESAVLAVVCLELASRREDA